MVRKPSIKPKGLKKPSPPPAPPSQTITIELPEGNVLTELQKIRKSMREIKELLTKGRD